ncbi:SUKH-4 family immunity protein [Ferruginibacter sp.]
MAPLDFKNAWTGMGEPLSPITKTRLDRFNLLNATSEFLTQAGLPVYCEPNLHFSKDTDDLFSGINKLTEQYDFFNPTDKFDQYIVIGSCRDGDPIAIDTANNDMIVQLDHEDLFNSSYFNSSITTLADFLIFFRDFEQEVLSGKGVDDSFNFTNIQFDQLKNKMFTADSKAITEEGFWKNELDIMLSIRKETFGIS